MHRVPAGGRLALLFPDPRTGARATGQRVLLAAMALMAGATTALLRMPQAFDTTWAEDAALFLTDAVTRPTWLNLITPYSGYLHMLPRLLAELVAFTPADFVPVALSVSAAVCSTVLALVVYAAAGAHLRPTAARLAVSAPMLLLPFALAELPLSIATLRWQLMYVMFWVLLWTPATRAGRVGLTVLVALAVTSDNVVILFLPLALLRWYVRRDRLSAALAAIVGLGTLIGLAIPVLGIDEHPSIQPRVNPFWAFAAFAVRPLPQLLFGEASVGDRPGRGVAGVALTAAAWAIVVAAMVVAWRWRTARWPLAALAAGYGAVMYFLVVMTSGYALTRYSVPTALLLVTTLVVLLVPPAGPPRLGRWLPFGMLALGLLVVCALNFQVGNVRSDGPLWSDGLTAARALCAAGAIEADIPVSPTALGWSATLPCEYLRR